MQTTKNVFENQIQGLQAVGYHFITYEDLAKYKNGEEQLYKKSCIVTFDDGYEGVYENAYPIAKKYNIPFTMFIIIDNMEQEGVITWDEAKQMQDSGLVTIASHSMNHPEFTNLDTETLNSKKTTPKIVVCPKCGNEVDPSDKFCAICGTEIRS